MKNNPLKQYLSQYLWLCTLLCIPLMSICQIGNEAKAAKSNNNELSIETSKEIAKKPLKSFKESAYTVIIKDGEIEKSLEGTDQMDAPTEEYYDIQGRLIEQRYYMPSVSYDSKTLFQYDEKGNIISEEAYSRGTELVKKTSYKYDVDFKIIQKQIDNHSSGLILTTYFTYNAEELLIQSIEKSGDFLSKRDTIVYDLSRKIIEKSFYDYSDELIEKCFYEYYNNEKLKVMECYNADDELTKKNTYANNQQQHILEEYILNPGYTLDKKISYQYNEKNDLIEILTSFSPRNTSRKTSYTYTYDEYNNWTQRVQYYNDEAIYILERELQYH